MISRSGFNKQVLLLLLLFGFSIEGFGMSLFDIGKICLFSDTRGQVILGGKPVEGATIKRSVVWKSQKLEDTAVTDKEGNFHFNAKFTNSLSKFMPVEAVITQNIIIHHNSNEYEGWKTNKRDFEENSELNGKVLNLVCDLSQESTVKEEGAQVIKGLCQW